MRWMFRTAWMIGFIVVTEHPFFQTTGTDGAFKLDNVPAGKYILNVAVDIRPQDGFGDGRAKQAVEAAFSYDGSEKAE